MIYNTAFVKICKPLFRISTRLLKISILGFLIGLVIGFLGHGWITLIISGGVFMIAVILSNIPNSYLVGVVKEYDRDISTVEATDLVQKHLKEPSASDFDTVVFVDSISSGNERVKRLALKDKNETV